MQRMNRKGDMTEWIIAILLMLLVVVVIYFAFIRNQPDVTDAGLPNAQQQVDDLRKEENAAPARIVVPASLRSDTPAPLPC